MNELVKSASQRFRTLSSVASFSMHPLFSCVVRKKVHAPFEWFSPYAFLHEGLRSAVGMAPGSAMTAGQSAPAASRD